MAIPNPVEGWSCGLRWAVAVGALVAARFAGRRMAPHARVMVERGRTGIVPFELLGSWRRALPVLAAWGAPGIRAARATLWWDTLLFIPAYVLLGGALAGAASAHAATRGWPGWADVAAAALWAFVAAAACDLVENAALHGVLRGDTRRPYPWVAAAFATVKFVLVVAASVVVATVGLLFLAAP